MKKSIALCLLALFLLDHDSLAQSVARRRTPGARIQHRPGELGERAWSPLRPDASAGQIISSQMLPDSMPESVEEGIPTSAPMYEEGPDNSSYSPYLGEPEPDFSLDDSGPPMSDGCGQCQQCCGCASPPWAHRSGLFGEFLYLQPRGANVAYAQPRDGLDPSVAVPVGPTAVVSPGYHAGYRVGGALAIDECTSIVAAFTSYNNSANDQVGADLPFSLHSLTTYPTTLSAASNSLQAAAQYSTNFRFADVDYRALLRGGPRWAINYRVGARYAHLEQDFFANQPISPGTTSVATNINFDGAGPRVGLDLERYGRCRNLFVYTKGFANFLVGSASASYLQTNTFALTQANTTWKDDRIVSILEYEAGLGWTSPRGHLRLSAGYYVAAWFNTVTTPDWIAGVQSTNFQAVSDTLTFDGLVTRAELRW